MSSTESLRDLYHRESSATWAFDLPIDLPVVSSSGKMALENGTKSSGPEWATRSPSRLLLDLSGQEDSDVTTQAVLKGFAAAVVLQYASATIAMPWEVAKLLLQVQWVPRNMEDMASETELLESEGGSDDDSEELSNDESYFTDPTGGESSRFRSERVAQKEGFVIQQRNISYADYIIPVGSANGVWNMIKRIGGFRGEGWLALWKGLLTFCVHDALFATMQPFFDELFSAIFTPNRLPYQQPGLILPILSHLITGFILSPLDLIRTRLIIQSFTAAHRTYTGPIDAFMQIVRNEGGYKALYFHRDLLIPTLIDQTLRPLVSLALPAMFAAYFGTHVSPVTHPIAWGIAELAGNCTGLLITLPFETARRRLQAQVRGSAKPVKACISLRPRPYVGVVDVLWRISTEERSDLPLKQQFGLNRTLGKKLKGQDPLIPRLPEEQDSWLRNTGIGQLYRGLGMRLGASVIVFILSTMSNREEHSGWAEL